MKKVYVLLLFVPLLVVLESCNKSKTYPSGNPSEVLSVDVYNKLQKDYKSIKKYQKGTAVVKRDKYGLIDEFGNEILPCEFDTIYGVKKNFRIIVKDSLYGATNIDGKIICDCRFVDVKDEGNSHLAFKSNDKWGFVDSIGKDITQYKYDDVYYFRDSIFVANYNGKCGVSDYSDNVIIPYKYEEILYKFVSNITRVKLGEFYGLYNSKDRIILDCEYNYINLNDSGFVTIEKKGQSYKDNRCALIEAETGQILIPFNYMDMGDFSEGLISAQNLEGKWGYLDKNGKIIIPFIYENAGDFHEGLAAVYKFNGYMNTLFGRVPTHKCGYIDKDGKVVIPFQFQETYTVGMCEFHNGLAVQGISESNKFAQVFGYIDKNGKWVIQPKYDDAEKFENGVAKVVLNNKYGYINTKGIQIIPCEYDKYGGYFVNDSIIQIKKGGVDYYFNLQGIPVVNPEL